MIKNYITVSLRILLSQKGYSFINILGLAIGMAAFFLISLFVRDELSYDRFYENSDRIYRVVLEGTSRDGPLNTAMSATNWAPQFESTIPEIERAVRLRPPNQMWLVAHENRKFFEKGFIFADSTVLDVFDFKLVQGSPNEILSVPFSVIITESMAQKYFGSEDPLGKLLRLDASFDFTVTGIMEDVPEQSHFDADFVASLSTLRTPIYGPNFLTRPLNIQIYTYLLLSPGSNPEEVTAKLDDFIQKTSAPMLQAFGVTIEPVLQPLTSIHLGSHLDSEIQANGSMGNVLTLSAVALFFLLIACINYMNLATARSAGRAREVGMRKVLGANRRQLIAQFLGESTVLAGFAVVLAVLFLFVVLPGFNTLTGKSLTLLSAGLLPSIEVFLGIVIVSGILAGSYPALFLSAFRPVAVLKGSSGQSTGSTRIRQVLVIFQFAISIALISAAVVVFQQLEYAQSKQLGFDKEDVVVVELSDPQIRNDYQTLRERVAALPSVASAAASSSAPGFLIQRQFIRPESAAPDEQTYAQSFMVDFDFIETMGMEIIAGRSHSRDFPADTLGAFILNEEGVKTLGWDSPENAIGQRMDWGQGLIGPVVGVVKNFHSESLHQSIEPTVITIANEQTYFYLIVRTRSGRTAEAIAGVEQIWNDLYPAYVYQYTYLDDDVARLYSSDQLLGTMFGGFASLAIFIACLGLFGLASFSAEQRTKEVGIRKVLGASIKSVIFMLSREFTIYVLVAFAIAAPLSFFAMQEWLNTFVYRIDFSFGTLVVVGLITLLISLATVSYQTVRAAIANPVDALHHE
ncbi:MAG: ABC transporter permease [Rhodothermia bacterium]|nr:MAG: ABC transporter permease [Rhodothermia bacterium]